MSSRPLLETAGPDRKRPIPPSGWRCPFSRTASTVWQLSAC